MLFAEMSSTFCETMADVFADLSKSERIEKAVEACSKDDRLTARKASKIYKCAHTTISRRLKEISKPKKITGQQLQLLSPIEERIIVKWAIQYYK
jgi:predicted HTH transcriptional regulator